MTHRDADAVQAARDLVARSLELAAGVQLRQHDLERVQPFSLGCRPTGMPRPLSTTVTELSVWMVTLISSQWPGQRLVDRVVDDLVDEVVQARARPSPMYMRGRLRTASSPSRTLIASVPYSSAPAPGAGGLLGGFQGGPRSFLEGFGRGSGARGSSRRARPLQRPSWVNKSRKTFTKAAADGPVPHPEERALRARRRLEQAAVGGREEHLPGERRGSREGTGSSRDGARSYTSSSSSSGGRPRSRPEVLNLGNLEREHERALLALAPEEPRPAAIQGEGEVVRVRPRRRVAPLTVALEPAARGPRRGLRRPRTSRPVDTRPPAAARYSSLGLGSARTRISPKAAAKRGASSARSALLRTRRRASVERRAARGSSPRPPADRRCGGPRCASGRART